MTGRTAVHLASSIAFGIRNAASGPNNFQQGHVFSIGAQTEKGGGHVQKYLGQRNRNQAHG